MLLFREFINDFITLLVAIDPIGSVPLLAALTHNFSTTARRSLVLRGVLIATIVLLCFAIFGNLLLKSLGVSFSSFRIAGGIILFLVGLKMLFADHGTSKQESSDELAGRDLAVFPVALPYIAGPGSMLAVMVEMRGMPEASSDAPLHMAIKILSLLLVMLTTLAILLFTTRLNRILGKTGSEVIARVMGILLAALAAESVVRGILEILGKAHV